MRCSAASCISENWQKRMPVESDATTSDGKLRISGISISVECGVGTFNENAAENNSGAPVLTKGAEKGFHHSVAVRLSRSDAPGIHPRGGVPDEWENRNGDLSTIQYPPSDVPNNFSRDFFDGREIVIKAPRRVVDRRVPRLPRKGWRHRIHTTDATRARSPCRARAVARGASRSAACIAKGSQVWGLGTLRKPTLQNVGTRRSFWARVWADFCRTKDSNSSETGLLCFLASFLQKEKK